MNMIFLFESEEQAGGMNQKRYCNDLTEYVSV